MKYDTTNKRLKSKVISKRRNCLLQAISPFLTTFSNVYISLVRQNAALCGNGLKTNSKNVHT